MNFSGTDLCFLRLTWAGKKNARVLVAWFHNAVFIQMVLGRLYETVAFSEDRAVLVLTAANTANDKHGSSTQALSRFVARAVVHVRIFQNRKAQLPTFKLSSSSSSHGIFMALHLFRITYRESYPPRGKLVWRELSIMLFEGHFPYFSHQYLGPSTLTSASAGCARRSFP